MGARFLLGLLAFTTPAVLLAACSPEERNYASGGSGGASSSSSSMASSSGGGEGGTSSSSSSSSSSSGTPMNPGELISSQSYPNGSALLFDLAVDQNGNSLLAGRFSGAIDFGDGALIDVGNGDIFLARHDRDDKLIFSKSYGSMGIAGIVRATVSPMGTIFATGDISDNTTINFGGNVLQGPGVWQVALGATGSPVIFDNMISPPTTMDYINPYSIAASSTEAAIFVGFYGGSIKVGQTVLTSAGDSDGYIIKYNPMGQIAWAKSLGGIGHENVSGIKIDATDNYYLTGYFTDSMPFGPGNTVTSVGGSDIFVAKIGPAGALKWIRQIGGTGEEFIFGTIAVAPNGDVIVAGDVSDTISVEQTVLPAGGANDVFVARYSTDGALIWAKRYGDASHQYVDSVAVDPNGNILLTGAFEGALDFGSGPLMAPPAGGAYLAKLDPGGKPIFTRVIAGQIGSIRVAVDGLSSILLAGTATNVSFELGSSSLPNGGIFWARLAP